MTCSQAKGAAITHPKKCNGHPDAMPSATTAAGWPHYLISVRILNIGRYIATTITPTMNPVKIMSRGSMIEVSDWMAASTSSS